MINTTALFAPALLTLALATAATAAPIEEGRSAYRLYDVSRAEAVFGEVAADPRASVADRGEASRELARIAWLVDGKGEAAAQRLARSLPKDPDPCPTAFLYGRILNSGPRVSSTPERLKPWIRQCADIEPGVAEQVTESWLRRAAATPANARAALVKSAGEAWRAMPQQARDGLEGERQHLALGLLAGDADTALAGWRGYLWLGDKNAPQAFEEPDATVLALFRNGVRRDASPDNAMALAELLVRAGFAEEARTFAGDHRLAAVKGPLAERWRKLSLYFSMREQLISAALDHDRAYARGKRDGEAAYEARLASIEQAATVALGRPKTETDQALHDAWGLYGTYGITNGVMSLHLGHVIIDEKRQVRQGGRTGEIRFIAIDNMIANAFSGWLADGESAPGGWATGGDTIIQVRPRYAESVLGQLALAKEGLARSRYVARTQELEAQDAALLAKTPVAYLPGMAMRLRLQAIDGLAAELRAGNPDPATFDQRFRQAWWDRSVEASIMLHEGRHVLDQAQFKDDKALSGMELEYRAKLSELSLSANPRVPMSSIHNPMMNGQSDHGVADMRIMTAYAEWIVAHHDEVAGFDPAQPAFAQLSKLTDQQLRAVPAALDAALAKAAP